MDVSAPLPPPPSTVVSAVAAVRRALLLPRVRDCSMRSVSRFIESRNRRMAPAGVAACVPEAEAVVRAAAVTSAAATAGVLPSPICACSEFSCACMPASHESWTAPATAALPDGRCTVRPPPGDAANVGAAGCEVGASEVDAIERSAGCTDSWVPALCSSTCG